MPDVDHDAVGHDRGELVRQWRDRSGEVPLASLPAGAQWAPTPPIAVLVDAVSALGPQRVSFRVAPANAGGRWTIDDVYVDPYGKG